MFLTYNASTNNRKQENSWCQNSLLLVIVFKLIDCAVNSAAIASILFLREIRLLFEVSYHSPTVLLFRLHLLKSSTRIQRVIFSDVNVS